MTSPVTGLPLLSFRTALKLTRRGTVEAAAWAAFVAGGLVLSCCPYKIEAQARHSAIIARVARFVLPFVLSSPCRMVGLIPAFCFGEAIFAFMVVLLLLRSANELGVSTLVRARLC